MQNSDDNQEPIKTTPDQKTAQAKSASAEKSDTTATNSTTGTALAKTLAILFIIAGLVIGFFIGIMINFGGCYKQSCSPLEENAALILPLASLLITLPVATIAFKKKKVTNSLKK